MRMLAFLLGDWVYKPYSRMIAALLRLKGMHVGRNLHIEGVPYLKINGSYADIRIGDNVTIMGNVDIRNRENGSISIGDGVRLDNDCRFVAANNARLVVAEGCRIGAYSIINCGDDITLGKRTLLAGFCYIQSSNHGIQKGRPIADQPHTYGKINIGDDVWLGCHVAVLAGVTIGQGAVVGANSVVAKDLPENAICAGVPARPISERS